MSKLNSIRTKTTPHFIKINAGPPSVQITRLSPSFGMLSFLHQILFIGLVPANPTLHLCHTHTQQTSLSLSLSLNEYIYICVCTRVRPVCLTELFAEVSRTTIGRADCAVFCETETSALCCMITLRSVIILYIYMRSFR